MQQAESYFRAALKVAGNYGNNLIDELGERWGATKPDLAEPTKSEVLGALLGRQARLSRTVARDPNLWSVDLGPMILRAMVETHLTLRWLAEKGRGSDFEGFVKHGLGQEKLLLEHLKAHLPGTARDRLPSELEPMQEWIDSQFFTFLLPVELSGWKSVRKMATELDLLDLYDLKFARYSSDVHGTWNSIAKVNLQVCVNPLHAFHRTPRFDEPALFLGILSSAVGLMADTYEAWAKAVGFSTTELQSVAAFYQDMDALPEHEAGEP